MSATLTAATGSFALAGKPLLWLGADRGYFAWGGSAAPLALGFPVSRGAYALTGRPVTFSNVPVLNAITGTYALTGRQVVTPIGVETGLYRWTMGWVGYTIGGAWTMAADTGVIVLSGAADLVAPVWAFMPLPSTSWNAETVYYALLTEDGLPILTEDGHTLGVEQQASFWKPVGPPSTIWELQSG